MTTISIIGVGRLGGALAIALSRAGFAVEQLVYRSSTPSPIVLGEFGVVPAVVKFEILKKLSSNVVLIATQDSAVELVAERIAPLLLSQTAVFHVSGSMSSEVLASVPGPKGSIHPLLSVSDPIAGAANFAGSFFCVEGDADAVACAGMMVSALGGKPFTIESQSKPLYHAAAVMASGHAVALEAAAIDVLSRCGLSTDGAREVLLPLITSTAANLLTQTPAKAMTGPFARADFEVIGRHLRAFDDSGLDRERSIYLELALKALDLAESGGRDPEEIRRIRDSIKLAQGFGK